jgi:NADH:ubiquinone oxidoreductase subunit F (NADH-binding)
MAGPGADAVAPPALVNNVETMANVAAVLSQGATWFRDVGTDESPGTIVCTVTGRTRRHGVAEVAMGTPLREVIDAIGGGAEPGRQLVAVMSGVASALLPATHLDAPVSYEGMTAVGTGLGTGGFIVFDDTTDLVAVVQGVSRFLAVESCGQCTPCKQDGLALADLLDRLRSSDAAQDTLAEIEDRVRTVADSARCSLATQHQLVVDSLLRLFPDAVAAHAEGAPAAEPELIAPIVDIVDGRAVLDEKHAAKQPDWTFDAVTSGQAPADRLDEHRAAR